MKIVVVQPAYAEDSLHAFRYITEALERTEQADLIVTPEYSNVPPLHDRAAVAALSAETAPQLLDAAQRAARRCSCAVCINMLCDEGEGLRNTTFLLDKTGHVVFRYHKQHLPPSEKEDLALDSRYDDGHFPACVFTLDGVKYAFMTCYDIYFNEQIEYIAGQKPDIVVLPSYQRGERRDILLAQCKLAAFRLNAFFIRASYSMGAESENGGQTSVYAPDGREIACIGQEVGTLTCEIAVNEKYYRTSGYGKPKVLSGDFIDYGKTESAFVPCYCKTDKEMPYPRICAHRGFHVFAPENSLPAFAEAVALGADEIALDVQATADGVLVVAHDSRVDCGSGVEETIGTLTYEALSRIDMGSAVNEAYSGLGFPLFEEVLRRFGKQIIMNIHLTSGAHRDMRATITSVVSLIRKYNCEKYVYLTGTEEVMALAASPAPDIARCYLDGKRDFSLVDDAIRVGADKVQFCKPHYTDDMVRKARAHDIVCNILGEDDPASAASLLENGMDTILTDNLLQVRRRLR